MLHNDFMAGLFNFVLTILGVDAILAIHGGAAVVRGSDCCCGGGRLLSALLVYVCDKMVASAFLFGAICTRTVHGSLE